MTIYVAIACMCTIYMLRRMIACSDGDIGGNMTNSSDTHASRMGAAYAKTQSYQVAVAARMR
jgi:hypothetical protein